MRELTSASAPLTIGSQVVCAEESCDVASEIAEPNEEKLTPANCEETLAIADVTEEMSMLPAVDVTAASAAAVLASCTALLDAVADARAEIGGANFTADADVNNPLSDELVDVHADDAVVTPSVMRFAASRELKTLPGMQ